MRRAAIVVGLALALVAVAASAQTITLRKWQDMGALVDRQSQAINALKTEVATLKTDRDLVVTRYDMLLRMLVIHACAHNERIASINLVFNWVQPIPLGNHVCPPVGSRYYIPSYLLAGGPPIPPEPGDTFERAAVGADWESSSGSTVSIVSGRLRVSGVTTWAKALGNDHSIEARMWTSATADYWPALVVRSAVGNGPQYRFVLAMGKGTWSVEYIDAAGTYTTIKTGSVAYVAGAKMKLEVKGAMIKASYNGAVLGTVDDARITAGRVGVAGFGVGTAEFDDVTVSGL